MYKNGKLSMKKDIVQMHTNMIWMELIHSGFLFLTSLIDRKTDSSQQQWIFKS